MKDNSNLKIKTTIEITITDYLNETKIGDLINFLDRYPDIVKSYIEGKEDGINIYPKDLILRTFKLEKPVTSIELQNVKDRSRIQPFINELDKFFFVNPTPSEIHISRFKTMCALANAKANKKYLKDLSLSDKYGDFAGISYGKSPIETAKYCINNELFSLLK
jgi:hypothetical protein